jgi:2-hydroxychromene-2-carboxylate isomerase
MTPAFYFDVGSPYVYLAAERLERLGLASAEWKPVSLGGLFKLTGRSSWGLTPEREAGMALIEARAGRYGLPPLRWPDPWPGHYLTAMRACLVAEESGAGEAFARVALRMGFVEGRDLSQPSTVWEAGVRVGLDPLDLNARLGAPEIKQRLIDETQAARDLGVVGVPTLAIGERLFWGDDQLELAASES